MFGRDSHRIVSVYFVIANLAHTLINTICPFIGQKLATVFMFALKLLLTIGAGSLRYIRSGVSVLAWFIATHQTYEIRCYETANHSLITKEGRKENYILLLDVVRKY